MTEPPDADRRSRRLPGYDFGTPGAYFVTICAYRRQLLFEDERVQAVINEAWAALPKHLPHVELDLFVVMPNHVHGIIWIRNAPGVGARHASPLRTEPHGAPPGSLNAIIGSFKSATTRELGLQGLHDAASLWQRSYYDRIIRNEAELNRIREYIAANPLMWHFDHENPNRGADTAYETAWQWLEHPRL